MFFYEKSNSNVVISGHSNLKEICLPSRLDEVNKIVYGKQPSVSYGEIFDACCAYNQPLSQFIITSDLDRVFDQEVGIPDYIRQMRQRNEGQSEYFKRNVITVINNELSGSLMCKAGSRGESEILIINSETPFGSITITQRFDILVDVLNRYYWQKFKQRESFSNNITYFHYDGTYRCDDRMVRVIFDPWGVISEINISLSNVVQRDLTKQNI